ncbi:hypothetical protein CBS9595_000901 [Malassezia furfur]|nr:hypothetical protein CBS9595_000901 [Malassezia furfur]
MTDAPYEGFAPMSVRPPGEEASKTLGEQPDTPSPLPMSGVSELRALPVHLGLSLSQGPYTDSPASPASTSSLEEPKNVRPAHVLPNNFRGPIPRESDAEEIAPHPHWVPLHDGASLGTLQNFPLNKNGWRYTAAGPAAHWLPETVYRTLELAPEGVHWSWQDRSAFMHISNDAMVVGTDKGFRSARTNLGVRHGAWYVEVEILPPDASSEPATPMRDGPHARVGFGRREAGLNAPVGWDAYSYGYRDRNGARVTLSRPQPFGRAFGPGDVIGMYIRLPSEDAPLPEGTEHAVHQKRVPIRYKGQLYFESLEYPPTKEMEVLMDKNRRGELPWSEDGSVAGKPTAPPKSTDRDEKRPGQAKRSVPLRPLPKLAESYVGFVVNGEPQGIAFKDLYDFRPLVAVEPTRKRERRKADAEITAHTSVSAVLRSRLNPYDDGSLGYYPMVSLYGGARARLIPSNFRYPPPAALEEALWEANAAHGRPVTRKTPAPPWRPFSARWGAALHEAVQHDRDADMDARPTAERDSVPALPESRST